MHLIKWVKEVNTILKTVHSIPNCNCKIDIFSYVFHRKHMRKNNWN